MSYLLYVLPLTAKSCFRLARLFLLDPEQDGPHVKYRKLEREEEQGHGV